MDKKFLYIFLFITGNIGLIYLDRLGFQYQPFLGFVLIFFHLIILIKFPYHKLK